MRQRLKAYIFLISAIFIIVYVTSEYYVKRLDEEIEIYNQRVNMLYNAHQVLYHVMAIQEDLFHILYDRADYPPDPTRTHIKELEEGIDNLSRGVSYIIYAGKDDGSFRVYSQKIGVMETIYPRFMEKVDAALMAKGKREREIYLKEAIEAGERFEVLTQELHEFVRDEYEEINKALPAMASKTRRLRNITGLLAFIAMVISSFVMFNSYKVYRKLLPFIKAIKDGDYASKVDVDNDEFGKEIVSTFNMLIERIKDGEKVSQSMSITDPLTGVYNRRYFDARVNEEMNRCIRYGTIFSLSLIDIDHFKEINDTYGHQVGDSVLRKIVLLIKENVRETDMVARYGGEEFVIIYPCTPKSGVLTQVERLRKVVEAHKFMDLNRQITISIGVADSAGRSSSDQVIQEADSSLYMAKSKGRNRCVIVGV